MKKQGDVIDVLAEKMRATGPIAVAKTTERQRNTKFGYDWLRVLDMLREQVPVTVKIDGKDTVRQVWEKDGEVLERVLGTVLNRASGQITETTQPVASKSA